MPITSHASTIQLHTYTHTHIHIHIPHLLDDGLEHFILSGQLVHLPLQRLKEKLLAQPGLAR